MQEKVFIIKNENGVHIKPARALVKKAIEFKATEILISKDSNQVDAKSLLSVLGLELGWGAEFKITVKGAQEEECLKILENILLEENLI